MTRRLRFEPEHLVDGLTFNERLSRLEVRVLGDKRIPGLEVEHEDTRRRLEELESAKRRAAIPWYLRWSVRRKAAP